MGLLACKYCAEVNQSPTKFLDKSFSKQDWSKIQHEIDCMALNGTWTLNETLRKSIDPKIPYYETLAQLSPCYNTKMYSVRNLCHHNLDGNSSFYYWKSASSCPVPVKRFSSLDFCRPLNGNIMMVGDSMTENMYHSLTNLEMFLRYGTQGHLHYAECCHQTRHCFVPLCDKKVYFMRNDNLSLTMVDLPFLHKENIHQDSWFSLLEKRNISILILNRGAHFEPNNSLVCDEIRNTLNAIYENYPNMSVVWRSTSPGHYKFLEYFFREPLAEFNNDIMLPEHHKNYHYELFESQNAIVDHFLAREFPQVLRLNIFPMMNIRADCHMDGLHYCIPGPLYAWIDLMFSAFDWIHHH